MHTKAKRLLKTVSYLLIGLIVCHMLLMCSSCRSKHTQSPAKQQTHHITHTPAPIPVDQIDQNHDGMISHAEAQQINQPAIATNTHTSIWIFACVGMATLLSCIICVWGARHTRATPARAHHTAKEPAAPVKSKPERLRRSNNK